MIFWPIQDAGNLGSKKTQMIYFGIVFSSAQINNKYSAHAFVENLIFELRLNVLITVFKDFSLKCS